jgi:hypothetical protein
MADQVVDPIDILDKAVSSSNPETRSQAAELINKKIENDKEGHINTNTQWAPLIFSLLGRDYKGALNAWNGGLTRSVDAYGPDNTRYIQEYNSRGRTGRVFDGNGNELKPSMIKLIDEAGGLISKEDITASSTGGFMSERAGVQTAAEAARAPALEAYKKAQQISLSSAGISNLYNEQAKIAQRSPWMDAVSKLAPEDRAKLFQFVSQQNQASQGTSTETGRTTSTTAGEQKGKSQTQGANLGADIGIRGAVPPEGGVGGAGGAGRVGVAPGLSTGVTGGESSFGNTQASSTSGSRSQAGATAGTSVLQQQTFQSQVNSILQNAIKDAQGFSDLQRFVSLQDQIRSAQEKRGVENLAPGATPVADLDPALSGRQNAAVSSYQGMKNEALLSAWNHFLAGKVHSSRGKPVDLAEASNEFMSTNVARGIVNRYDQATNTIRTGKAYEPQKGDIIVDNRNKPKIWSGERWESLNGK